MIIVSGPSTVGKNPFIYKVCELFGYEYIIPYTTRKKRTNELDGKDYHFIDIAEFQAKIHNREMDEWDYCLENYYGYIFDFNAGEHLITHGLSRMTLRIKAKYPIDVKTIFLMPDNIDRIFSNLKQIYSGKMLELRMMLVEEEICHASLFDKIITCPAFAIDLLKEEQIKQLFEK